MSKRIRYAIISVALSAVVALSVAMSACTIKTNHPRAKISVSFNSKNYDIEYELYRNMYPQTVQRFIELADSGYYDDMIIHDYTSTDWLTGAYSYNEADNNVLEGQSPVEEGDKLDYKSAYDSSAMREYLERNSKEEKFYEIFNKGKGDSISTSVYKKISYDKNGKEYVDDADALPTLIGEFSENDHNIEKGALPATFGALKMVYYDKGNSNQKVVIKNSFGQIMEHDYKYNCATGVFSMQVGSGSSYTASKYCVFAQLKDDGAKDKLEELLDAISDYITDSLGGSSGKFTSSVTTKVDTCDTYAEEGGREIEKSFTVTSLPLIIKSVKITKY